MISNRNAWFSFCGVTNSSMGVELLSAPTRAYPSRRGKMRKDIAGRDGFIFETDKCFESYQIRVECCAGDSADMDAILLWLSGSGMLIFSDEPNRAYDARIVTSFTRTNFSPRVRNQRFILTWEVQPFRLLYPEAPNIVITTSGTAITAQGTAPSLPRISIVGNGYFSLTIGRQRADFRAVDGGIIIDSLLGDAFTADGALLANDKMDGELFRIDPLYTNTVSWLTGGEDDDGNTASGSVTRVTITPRWRFL